MKPVEESSDNSDAPQDPDMSKVGKTLFEEDFFGAKQKRMSSMSRKASMKLHPDANKRQTEAY